MVTCKAYKNNTEVLDIEMTVQFSPRHCLEKKPLLYWSFMFYKQIQEFFKQKLQFPKHIQFPNRKIALDIIAVRAY